MLITLLYSREVVSGDHQLRFFDYTKITLLTTSREDDTQLDKFLPSTLLYFNFTLIYHLIKLNVVGLSPLCIYIHVVYWSSIHMHMSVHRLTILVN